MNRTPVKKYVKIMSGFFITTLISIGLFNYFINPYNIFDLPEKHRPRDLIDKSHITKAVKLIHNRADTLLIGTSIVDHAFRVKGSLTVYEDDHFKKTKTAFKSLIPAETQIYNAGIRGGGIGDIYHYLQHAIKNNPNLKHIILGVEWNLFSSVRKADDFVPDTQPLGKTYVPFHFYANNLFSYAAMYDSTRTVGALVKSWLQHKHRYAKRHGYDITKTLSSLILQYQSLKYQTLGQFTIQNIPYNVTPNTVIQGQNMHDIPALVSSIVSVSAIKNMFNHGGDKVVLNEESWEYMRRIVALAKKYNIKLDVYASPQHASFWETMKRYGMESYNYLWLKKLADITPFWDFSERIDFSDNVDNYFDTDALHFNPEAGKIILPAIMNGKGDGVRYVTSQNINEHIRMRQIAQEKWLNGQPYLKAIFDHPLFMETKNLDMIRYMPVVNGYQIVQFMNKYMALPVSDKPYDFRLVFMDKYPGAVHGSSVEDVRKLVVARHVIASVFQRSNHRPKESNNNSIC